MINHPNFGRGLTAADLLSGRSAHLLETADAHPIVNNGGGGESPDTDAMWDSMLTAGLTIDGVASDDEHGGVGDGGDGDGGTGHEEENISSPARPANGWRGPPEAP